MEVPLDSFDLFSSPYPCAPGHRGVQTSMEAAAGVTSAARTVRSQVLAAITRAGFEGRTADELAAELGVDRWTCQPRTSELRKERKIVDSGRRRRNASGKRAIVWTLPGHEEGLA